MGVKRRLDFGQLSSTFDGASVHGGEFSCSLLADVEWHDIWQDPIAALQRQQLPEVSVGMLRDMMEARGTVDLGTLRRMLTCVYQVTLCCVNPRCTTTSLRATAAAAEVPDAPVRFAPCMTTLRHTVMTQLARTLASASTFCASPGGADVAVGLGLRIIALHCAYSRVVVELQDGDMYRAGSVEDVISKEWRDYEPGQSISRRKGQAELVALYNLYRCTEEGASGLDPARLDEHFDAIVALSACVRELEVTRKLPRMPSSYVEGELAEYERTSVSRCWANAFLRVQRVSVYFDIVRRLMVRAGCRARDLERLAAVGHAHNIVPFVERFHAELVRFRDSDVPVVFVVSRYLRDTILGWLSKACPELGMVAQCKALADAM